VLFRARGRLDPSTCDPQTASAATHVGRTDRRSSTH
jgi:hypothetical protein